MPSSVEDTQGRGRAKTSRGGTIYGNRLSIPVSIHFAVFEKMCALPSPTSAGPDGQDKLKFNSYAQHVLARIVLDAIDQCMFS